MSIDGVQLPAELQRRIKSVSITFQEGKGDTGKVSMLDPDLELFDARVFQEGRKLSFILGWDNECDARGPYPIKKISPSLPSDGELSLTVDFQDMTQKINKCQKQQKHVNVAPHVLVKRIAQAHGLGYDIDSIRNVEFTDDDPLIQANQTDAKLLHRLSLKYGYVWGIEGGVLYFRRPETLRMRGQQGRVKVLSYRINDRSLESFAPEISMQEDKKKIGGTSKDTNVDLDKGKTFKNLLDRAKSGKFDPAMLASLGGAPKGEREAAGQEIVSFLEEAAGGEGMSVPDLSEIVMPRGPSGNEGSGGAGSLASWETDGTQQSLPATDGGGTGPKIGGTFADILLGKMKREADPNPEPGATSATQTHNEAVESEPGDESGAAAPVCEDESNKRAGAKIGPRSEVIKATAKPAVACIRWRPGHETIIAGVGERMSGLYKVQQVDQSVTQDSFQTSLKVVKRKFMYGDEELRKMAEAAQKAQLGEAYDQPDEVNPLEERRYSGEPEDTQLIDGKAG